MNDFTLSPEVFALKTRLETVESEVAKLTCCLEVHAEVLDIYYSILFNKPRKLPSGDLNKCFKEIAEFVKHQKEQEAQHENS